MTTKEYDARMSPRVLCTTSAVRVTRTRGFILANNTIDTILSSQLWRHPVKTEGKVVTKPTLGGGAKNSRRRIGFA